MKKVISFIITFCILIQNKGQQLEIHETPGKDFADFVHTTITPDVIISPTGDFLIQHFSPNYLSINCLPNDEIKIAGITFNPNNYNRTRQRYDTSLILTSIYKKNDFKIEGLPVNPRIFFIRWSPDGKFIAFANETSNVFELWICQVSQKKTWRIANISLNAVINQSPIIWQNDSKSFLVSATLTNREKPETIKSVYTPLVFNNTGTWGNLSGSANLIKSPNDEKLFEYYGQSQLYSVTIEGITKPIGQPTLQLDAVPSPDGKFILVQMIRPPFSYTAPYLAFPRKVEVWENNGTLYRELFELPSTENIATGMGALPKGPRNIGWRPDVPSTLFWFKTLDGGNPERKATLRDRLYFYATPFDGEGIGVLDFENRINEIYWGNPTMAICNEEWPISGEKRISWFNPSVISPVKQLIFSYNKQNANPGEFLTTNNYAQLKILTFSNKNQKLFISGQQLSMRGIMPFIDQFDISTLKTERLWQCDSSYFEKPICLIDGDKKIVVTCRESFNDMPNYFSRNLKNGVVEQITNYLSVTLAKDKPYSQLFQISTPDSVVISGEISYPPGFSTGTKLLPALVWINPQRYINKSFTNDYSSCCNHYQYLLPENINLWSLKGYAVINITTLPLITDPKGNFMPTFDEQLKQLSKSIISFLDSLPNIDQSLICIGGINGGALLAAQFVFQTNRFTAGIGVNGGYYTNIPSIQYNDFFEQFTQYPQMSIPTKQNFSTSPFLLIDGQISPTLDQSIQMYTAIKSGDGNTRLVILPEENASFIFTESIQRVLWETENWLNLNLKKKK